MKLGKEDWLVDVNVCVDCVELDVEHAKQCKMWKCKMHNHGALLPDLGDIPDECPRMVEHYAKAYNAYDWISENLGSFRK